MELRQLRHFVAVVDSANLSRAAERVAISQPALTRSIKNLEDLLGVELLERQPRGVVPTEAGLALYHHAQIVLNACLRLTREVRELERGTSGTVYVGVGSLYATHITSRVAENLSESQPRLALVINEAFFEELLVKVKDTLKKAHGWLFSVSTVFDRQYLELFSVFCNSPAGNFDVVFREFF
jgi:DNA-binding transcriptional LysR family regulator